jgi:hypothetical protein
MEPCTGIRAGIVIDFFARDFFGLFSGDSSSLLFMSHFLQLSYMLTVWSFVIPYLLPLLVAVLGNVNFVIESKVLGVLHLRLLTLVL